MRILSIALAFATAAAGAACSGDVPPPTDGGHVCTGTAYDLCATEHDCTTGTCFTFNTQMLEICTVACGGSNPCPADSSGAAGTCDNGRCRPAAANDCVLMPH